MNIDRDPDILERQMQEVLKSLGVGTHIVQVAIPTDEDLPSAKYSCDHHFHMGEAYLVANQALLAIRRFNQALAEYDGRSAYENFSVAVKLALAECYSAIDVQNWENAIKVLNEIIVEFPEEDRAHAIFARVHIRRGEPIEAYKSAMAALKSNPENFEAACYLGFVGFSLSKTENNLSEMAKDIDNLKQAQRLYPQCRDLAKLIENCEAEFRVLSDK